MLAHSLSFEQVGMYTFDFGGIRVVLFAVKISSLENSNESLFRLSALQISVNLLVIILLLASHTLWEELQMSQVSLFTGIKRTRLGTTLSPEIIIWE